ncbi:MAG: DEAD/DEAH box helicase family protein, partial [Pseudonocardiaceae bacterium]
MPELTVDRFDEFLAAVHQDSTRTAFPWQQQLLEELLGRHDEAAPWPTAIDAPTGLGKTSVLDVAVFATAAGLPLRRVFFVVDRRIVVDEAYEHARHLERRVHPDAEAILGEVGTQLATLTGGSSSPVVSATRMRGGITWDWRWMDRPDRFGIVVGTVDQVGSRLLFRGYGLSDRLAPIDAAL